MVLPKTSKPYPAGDMTLASTTLGWRLVNPAMNKDWTISLGEATERSVRSTGSRVSGRMLLRLIRTIWPTLRGTKASTIRWSRRFRH